MRKTKLISLLLAASLVFGSLPLMAQPVFAEADIALGDAATLEGEGWSGATVQPYLPIFMRGQIYGIRPASHSKSYGIWLYDASSDVEGVNTFDETVSFDIKVTLRDTEPFLESLGGNNVIKHANGLQFSVGTDNANSGTVFTDIDINNDGVNDRYDRYSVTNKVTWDGSFKEITRTITYEDLVNHVTSASNNPTGDTNLNLYEGILRKGKGLLSIGANGISYQYSGTNAAGEAVTLYDYAPVDIMGISVVKNYAAVNEATGESVNKAYTLYSWGSYSDGNWDPKEVVGNFYGELSEETYVDVANETTSYMLDTTLAPGKYRVSGTFCTDAGELSLKALSDGFDSNRVSVGTEATSCDMVFSVDTETYVEELTLAWSGDGTATKLYLSDIELEYVSDAVMLNDLDRWTGAQLSDNTYAEVWVRGGGYGTGDKALNPSNGFTGTASIPVYKPDGSGAITDTTVGYTLEVVAKYIDVKDVQNSLLSYGNKNTAANANAIALHVMDTLAGSTALQGWGDTGNDANSDGAKDSIALAVTNDSLVTYTYDFKITNTTRTYNWIFYVGNVDTATGKYTPLKSTEYAPVGVSGVRVYQTDAPDNVVYTWGTFADESESQWSDISRNYSQSVIYDENAGSCFTASISDGAASYSYEKTLTPGIYKLSGDFSADADTLVLDASADDIKMTVGATEDTSIVIDTEKSALSFILTLTEETDISELVLNLGKSASSNASALKFENVEFERIAAIGAALNLDRGAWIAENGSVENWVSEDGYIEESVDKWWNFATLSSSARIETSFDAQFTDYPNDRFTGYVIARHNGDADTTVRMRYRQGASGFERYANITTEWAEYKFNTGGMYNSDTGKTFGTTAQHNYFFLQPDSGMADVDIQGIKIVKTNAADSSIKETVYAWGVYADDWSAPPTSGTPSASFVDDSSVKLTGAKSGATFTYDISDAGILLPVGTYLIRADVKSENGAQIVGFSATAASGESATADVALDTDKSTVGVTLTVGAPTALTGITLDVAGSDPICVNNVSIVKGVGSVTVPSGSTEGWTGVEYVNEDYVTTTLLGGGYGLTAIKLYDPSSAANSVCELGKEYKYYINVRTSRGNTDKYALQVGMSPNGYSAGRFHFKAYTPTSEWNEFSSVFTIPSDVTTVEVVKIVTSAASGVLTDWDFRGIKIVEAANENNVVFALGCYDTTLEPSEWTFSPHGSGSGQVYHHDEWFAADVSLGSVSYDVYDVSDVELARGVYKLTGDFWTDAGTLMLDAAIGDNTAKEDAVEIAAEKTTATFSIAVEEGTPLSEIILSWTADDSGAAELRFANIKLEPVGTLAFGECGDDLEWAIHGDGTLAITGTGDMWDMAADGAPWSDYVDDITALTIEEGVTTIGGGAFAYCDGIVGEVVLPSTLTSIGDEVFMSCSGITSISAIPSGVTYIGAYAFADCTALGGALTIPASIAEIGDYAFDGCALDSVTFETRTVVLGNNVFSEADDFVIYGYANSTAEAYAAENAHTFVALREVLYGGICGDNTTWEVWSDGVLVVSGTGAIDDYADGTDTPWYDYRDIITTVEVEEGITAIGTAAFRFLGNVKTATLPDTLLKIGAYAFDYCEKLESVNVPSGVTTVGDWAFGYCRSLTEIDLPDSVKSVGNYLFYKCSSLVSAGLPSDITAITDGMFENCYSLKSIDWPNAVTEIGETAFAGCVSLNYVDIPEGVTTIGAGAFRECEWLYTLVIPESVTSIGTGILDICQYVTVCGYEGSLAEQYAIANGHTFIAFEVATVASGELDGGITWAILDNGKLTVSGEGDMPGFDEAAPAPWYEYRRHFDTVLIEDGVTSIGAYAFFGCRYVERVVIPASVTEIGEYAFAGCSDLATVAIPESVSSIGEGAFSGCISLTRITIPASITAIADYTFDGCITLESVTLASSVKTIGKRAFYGCASLTDLDLGSGVTTIGDYAFRSCVSLTELTLPRSVSSIGVYAFADLQSIAEVTVLSHNAIFTSGAFSFTPSAVIFYGFDGSTAQTYAKSISRTFVVIEDTVVDITDAINASLVAPTTATVKTADGKWIEGENTFSVSCDKPCRVFVTNDGGDTYDRLTATANSSGGYDFTATLTSESKIVVILVGDVDGNGTIELADYALAREIFLDSTYEADVLMKIMTDSDESGKTTVSDITFIKRILLGYVTTW